MIEFIDKTSEKDGTYINRKNMMALQGFDTTTITINPDGSFSQTNSKNEVYSIKFNDDGSFVESFTGEKTITKITVFDESGTIREEIIDNG